MNQLYKTILLSDCIAVLRRVNIAADFNRIGI